MQSHIYKGIKGEEAAKALLIEKGHEIIAVNWRYKQYEIDILSHFKSFLVITEVKTRTGISHGEPESFVNPVKQRKLKKAANFYIELSQTEKEIRFDIISVLINGDKLKINHIEDAFMPF